MQNKCTKNKASHEHRARIEQRKQQDTSHRHAHAHAHKHADNMNKQNHTQTCIPPTIHTPTYIPHICQFLSFAPRRASSDNKTIKLAKLQHSNIATIAIVCQNASYSFGNISRHLAEKDTTIASFAGCISHDGRGGGHAPVDRYCGSRKLHQSMAGSRN